MKLIIITEQQYIMIMLIQALEDLFNEVEDVE